MLSSRNRDRIPDGAGTIALEDVRKELQQELEAEQFCDHQLIEVWINETAGAESGDANAWEQCMREAARADLVVVIYNGHAGWARDAGGNGICHDEFHRTWRSSPNKLRLVVLDFPSDRERKLIGTQDRAKESEANQRFAKSIAQIQLFRASAADRSSLVSEVKLAVVKGVTDLVGTGAREGRRGRGHLGSPLDWSRLTYRERKAGLEKAVISFLTESFTTEKVNNGVVVPFSGGKVLTVAHGVPSGFGQSEARELVGRPYLRDHIWLDAGATGWIGPLHVIACHKNATESQIIDFVGHPDVYLVKTPFGFFVADQLSFVQSAFLTGCSDHVATTSACEQLFDWLTVSGENVRLVQRAQSRARLLKAIAAELATASV